MHPVGEVLVGVTAAGAIMCWLGAFVSWLRMLGNMSGRMSVVSMLFRGMAAFDPENFNERGQRFRRWFVRFFVGFFAMLIAMIGALMIATRL
jgi:hypothetical protein